jgi:ribosomal-protein-alanine N-acetyltransferase
VLLVEAWVGGASTAERLRDDRASIEAFARPALREPTFDLANEVEKPWARVWTARPHAGAGVIGFLIAWHVADELHILSVAVAGEARRRGIGRALMTAALTYARSNAVRLLLLEVRRSNRAAIKLYRTFSFSALGVRPQYYADTGEDAVEMILTLDPGTGALVASRDEVRIED